MTTLFQTALKRGRDVIYWYDSTTHSFSANLMTTYIVLFWDNNLQSTISRPVFFGNVRKKASSKSFCFFPKQIPVLNRYVATST